MNNKLINEKITLFRVLLYLLPKENLKKLDPLHLAGVRSGSTFPGSGFVDPDPHQNEVDLQHWQRVSQKSQGLLPH